MNARQVGFPVPELIWDKVKFSYKIQRGQKLGLFRHQRASFYVEFLWCKMLLLLDSLRYCVDVQDGKDHEREEEVKPALQPTFKPAVVPQPQVSVHFS